MTISALTDARAPAHEGPPVAIVTSLEEEQRALDELLAEIEAMSCEEYLNQDIVIRMQQAQSLLWFKGDPVILMRSQS
jgi:hypothetical protein